MTDFKESLYTINNKTGGRNWVYSSLIKGKLYYKRAVVAYLLLAIYLLAPWISIGGKQAVLLNIVDRQFTLFGLTFWATDTDFLVIILLLAGLSLFFFTSLLGRVWCGWACPETVFLEFVFRPIERLIEGDAAQRIRLDRSPWNFSKISKKLLKHAFCAFMAWIIASTAIAYFIGREPLLNMMAHSPSEHWGLFTFTLIYMGFMAFQFGWFREQFCTVLCPYARFQSVLMDRYSLGIGYNVLRGEPRGKASKKVEEKLGDCVDCGLCVRVCPTGIDIRNGAQLECIHCGCCADACDSVMEKLDRPTGLIRYGCEETLVRGGKYKLSPRPFIYSAIIVILLAVLGYRLATRQSSEFTIVRGAYDAPFVQLDANNISNHIHAHISNKGEKPENYTFKVNDDRVKLVTPLVPFKVEAESLATAPLFLNFSTEILDHGKLDIIIEVTSESGFSSTQKITLLGPG